MRYEEAIQKHEPLTPYEQGMVDALYAFAWMKDGTYYVGSGVYTLGDAVDRKITEHRERRGVAEPVPASALDAADYPYPTRRVSLGLTRGGEMQVSLPGKPDEPIDERTLEALRAIGEATLDRMIAEESDALDEAIYEQTGRRPADG